MTELIETRPWGDPGPIVVTAAKEARDHESRILPSQWPSLFYKQYFQPREQFSSSQLETAECPRAWGYRYLSGLRTREYSWLESLSGEGTKKDRSLAFGKALHSAAEAYYQTGNFDQTSAPGRALLAGLHLLPHPTQCQTIEIELPIDLGTEPAFIGYKDLVTQVNGEWYLFDYKSTKSFDYQKGLDDRTVRMGSRSFEIHGLRNDLAGASYAVDVMRKKSLTNLRGRWVYFKSEGRPEAKATDVSWQLSRAEEILGQGLIKAESLVKYIRGQARTSDLPANGDKCEAFGGCPYHKDRNGPCEGAPKSQYLIGDQLVKEQAQSEGDQSNMANPNEQQPGESAVQFKIRQARNFAAQSQGQAAPPAQTQGFAPPPPGGFIQPPGNPAPQNFAPPAAPAPPQQFAPPNPALPPPPGPAYVPVTSHVLPPEAALPPAPAPQFAPPPAQLPAGPAPAPEVATAPARRRGRPAGSRNAQPTPGTTLSQAFAQTVEIDLDFGGDTSVTVRANSTEDAQALAGLIQAALS